ncbi:MAG TPA: DUF3086 domain-containing protein, partial [Cyanobacteria bacterium UBA12227]|nr:DUF3086 domain-containing protein [Cyanobacteria bacterium UBA12227]
EQEQEQQLTVEDLDKQQLQPELEAEMPNDLNEPVTEVELSQPEAQELPNLEELTVEVEAVQALEVPETSEELTQTVADLQRQEQELREKIAALQEIQSQLLSEQLTKTQTTLEQMVQEGLSELEQRKQALLISIEQLERRRERIRTEMRT